MDVAEKTVGCFLGLTLLIMCVHSMDSLGLRIKLVNNFDIEFSPSKLQKFYKCLCSSRYSLCKVMYRQMDLGYMMVYQSQSLEENSTVRDFVCVFPHGNATEFTCKRDIAFKNLCDENERCEFSLLKVMPGIDCPYSCIALGWTGFQVRYEHFDTRQTINATCGAVTNVTDLPQSTEQSSTETTTVGTMWTSTLGVTDDTDNATIIWVIVACVLLIVLICLCTLAACWRKRQMQYVKKDTDSTNPISGNKNDMEWSENQKPTRDAIIQDKLSETSPSDHAYCTVPDKPRPQSEGHDSTEGDPLGAADLAYSEPRKMALGKAPVGNETRTNKEDVNTGNCYSRVNIGRNASPASISEGVLQTYDCAPGISHRSFVRKELIKENSSVHAVSSESTKSTNGESPHVYSRLDNGRQEIPKETSQSFLEIYDGPVISQNRGYSNDESSMDIHGAESSEKDSNVYSRLDNGRRNCLEEVSTSVLETYC